MWGLSLYTGDCGFLKKTDVNRGQIPAETIERAVVRCDGVMDESWQEGSALGQLFSIKYRDGPLVKAHSLGMVWGASRCSVEAESEGLLRSRRGARKESLL